MTTNTEIKTWQERVVEDMRTFAVDAAMKAEIAELRGVLEAAQAKLKAPDFDWCQECHARESEVAEQTVGAVVADERAGFEKWIKTAFDNAGVRLKCTDQYVVPDVQAAWKAWKARAALATQPEKPADEGAVVRPYGWRSNGDGPNRTGVVMRTHGGVLASTHFPEEAKFIADALNRNAADDSPRNTCSCAHIGECDGSCAPYIAKPADVGGVEPSADQIEELMPDNEGNNGSFPCDKCGWIQVSAQWLHDFANAVHKSALAAQPAAPGALDPIWGPKNPPLVYGNSTQPAALGVKCWSCKKPYTADQRSDCDGDCPHCGVELDEEEPTAPQPVDGAAGVKPCGRAVRHAIPGGGWYTSAQWSGVAPKSGELLYTAPAAPVDLSGLTVMHVRSNGFIQQAVLLDDVRALLAAADK